MGNRWSKLVSPASAGAVAVAEDVSPDTVPVLHGAAHPQIGVAAPHYDRQLGSFTTSSAGPFWLGVHGGAGESTLTELLGGVECHHRWPSPAPSSPAPAVVLVARQTHRGLEAARRAAQSWAAGGHPEVVLAGLAVVAAAPGKTPRELRGQTRVTAGGVPRTWTVPWIEELRLTGAVAPDRLPQDAHKALIAIDEAVTDIIEGKH